jgi:hypothetical protein
MQHLLSTSIPDTPMVATKNLEKDKSPSAKAKSTPKTKAAPKKRGGAAKSKKVDA